MLSYQYASAAAEGLLLRVNQSVGHHPRKPGPGKLGHGKGQLRRQLARAAARIERRADHQRSLADMAELASSFQAELDPAQKDRWLALEDAMLEHVARLTRSYFYAGAAWGKRLARSRRTARLDREVIVGLAALIAKLARR
jgi:hypothetical protein